MDKIIIKNLEFFAYHGVLAEEKKTGQRFVITVEISLNLREAGISDLLDKTVNYADVCSTIEKVFVKSQYDLIETCAEKIAERILNEYSRIDGIKVLIEKPEAPVDKKFDYVAVEIERSWHRAYIGLGSNMGDKEAYINDALSLLNDIRTRVVKKSKLYNTKPVGYTEQDDFLNCVAEVKTLLEPKELLGFAQNIEKVLKRERTIRWGPRTIDLDILLYDDLITADEELILPHPAMHERLFVLEPLCDIAPFIMHPYYNKRMTELRDMIT